MQDNTQLTHNEHKKTNTQANKKVPLSIIANDIVGPLNVGSLFRICDALGIQTLYLCGETPAPPNNKINKTSRSTDKHVNYEIHTDAETLATSLKKSGALIISLEITSSRIDISSNKFKATVQDHIKAQTGSDHATICLILGSENTGVSEPLLSLSDITTHIEMAGNNSSMNVISAASIACFEITRHLSGKL
jgi:tRNA G18 (ribose-2'-O)-methylase SpoU